MRPAVLVLAATLALAGCSDSPCQELGERICACQPGTTNDSCKTRVEDLVDDQGPSEGYCEDRLTKCNAPADAVFCEWLLTADGAVACGLAPERSPGP